MNIKKTSRCLGLKELMFIGKRVGFNFLKRRLFSVFLIYCKSKRTLALKTRVPQK